MGWLWVNAVPEPFDHPRCNAKNRWRFVGAHFEEVVAISSVPFLPIEAADTLIIDQCWCIALSVSMMQDQKLSTLRLPWKAANTLILALCRCTAVWISKVQAQKSLTLRWLSFSQDSSDVVASIISFEGSQYFDYVSKWWSLFLIIRLTRPKIFDESLMHISRMG